MSTSSPQWCHVAVDLGASSGRVIQATIDGRRLVVRPIHRFVNRPIVREGVLRWDLDRLCAELRRGMEIAASAAPRGAQLSVGIDSWAVDYCLLDASGRELDAPRHYRDAGIATGVEAAHRAIPPEELYRSTGTQFLPFNTIYQLVADANVGRLAEARTVLMIPDAIIHRLTGNAGAEVSNASTTGLFDVRNRRWDQDIVGRLGLDAGLLPDLYDPGSTVGATEPHGGRPYLVVRVASHDTASAVVAAPATEDGWAYISSGTWSLVGVELDRPVITEAGRAANFTNELGPDGTVRYLRNVAGMWLLQESLRTWKAAGRSWRISQLLAAAAERRPGPVFDPDHPDLLAPGDMPSRIRALCGAPARRLGDDVAVARSIMDSLATRYAEVIDRIEATTGRPIRTVHVVGGGSRNALLCQLTADACQRPVVAGPTEATALGNLLIQARACGSVSGELAELRQLAARSARTRTYPPRISRGR